MKPKTVVLLAIAVGSGLLAMIGVQQAMSGSSSQVEETVKVAVAIADINIGVGLTEANVAFQEMPKSAVLFNDAILDPDYYTDRKLEVQTYAERSAVVPLGTGDIIRMSKLSKPGMGGKSLQIPPGMRVLTITVDERANMAGLLSPGDRVDVMVTYSTRDRGGRQNTKTTTLLEYVEVFSTDDRTAREANTTDDGRKSAETIGLLLAPENVPYVKLAESKGKLGISWRRRDDDEIASVGPINEELLDELRGLENMSGGVPGYDQFAPPLYGDGPEPGNFVAGPTENFGGIGRPKTETTPEAMDSMLTQAESGQAMQTAAPAPAPKVAAAPAKPKWQVQVYVGNQAVNQEFEIPESELPKKEELKDVGDAVNGGQIWSLLKQAL